MAIKNEKPKSAPRKVLGVEFAPLHLPWERRWQTLCVTLWFFLFFGIVVTGYPIVIYLMIFSTYKTFWCIILIPYLAWIWIIDPDTCNKGGRCIPWVRKWRIWKGYNDYFPIKLVKTCDLDPSRNYLICSHPHGVLCSGAFGSFCTDYQNLDKLFPGISFHFLTLELNFRWPLSRDLSLSFGTCAVSRKGMNYLLSKKGGGIAAILVPGGAPESLDCHPGSYVIQLKNRKGFVKVAIQNGAWLVPCFTFGETEIYDQPANPKGSLLRTVQDKMLSTLQFAPIFMRGRGIFQYTWGLLPHRRPLTVVVGAPIEVVKTEQPSIEMIAEVHQKYVQALENLFYEHREKYALDPSHVITIL